MQQPSIEVVLFNFGGVLAEEGFREGLIAIARLNNVDPSVFDDVADALNVAPELMLGIDDSRENIERARQKGLPALLYQKCNSFEKQLISFLPSLQSALNKHSIRPANKNL